VTVADARMAPGRRGTDEERVGGTLVVGYGNALRGDDGAGGRAAALLARDPRLADATVLARHQLTPELAWNVSRASLVILVDASSDEDPGAVSVRRVEATDGAGSASSHALDPGALVALARVLWDAAPPVFVVSVGAASMEMEDRLSPEVERALPVVVDAVAAIVAEHADA
jgi:hydrogenase maturation protease